MNSSMISASGGGLKSHRFNNGSKQSAMLEVDKHINKLTLENQIMNEKLKAINFQIERFLKEQLQQQGNNICNDVP